MPNFEYLLNEALLSMLSEANDDFEGLWYPTGSVLDQSSVQQPEQRKRSPRKAARKPPSTWLTKPKKQPQQLIRPIFKLEKGPAKDASAWYDIEDREAIRRGFFKGTWCVRGVNIKDPKEYEYTEVNVKRGRSVEKVRLYGVISADKYGGVTYATRESTVKSMLNAILYVMRKVRGRVNTSEAWNALNRFIGGGRFMSHMPHLSTRALDHTVSENFARDQLHKLLKGDRKFGKAEPAQDQPASEVSTAYSSQDQQTQGHEDDKSPYPKGKAKWTSLGRGLGSLQAYSSHNPRESLNIDNIARLLTEDPDIMLSEDDIRNINVRHQY